METILENLITLATSCALTVVQENKCSAKLVAIALYDQDRTSL